MHKPSQTELIESFVSTHTLFGHNLLLNSMKVSRKVEKT